MKSRWFKPDLQVVRARFTVVLQASHCKVVFWLDSPVVQMTVTLPFRWHTKWLRMRLSNGNRSTMTGHARHIPRILLSSDNQQRYDVADPMPWRRLCNFRSTSSSDLFLVPSLAALCWNTSVISMCKATAAAAADRDVTSLSDKRLPFGVLISKTIISVKPSVWARQVVATCDRYPSRDIWSAGK